MKSESDRDAISARVLFVTHDADIGGPAHSLLMLVRHLKKCYGVAVLLPEEGRLCSLLRDERVQYFVIPGLGRTTIPRIYQLIRREGFDLIYGNSPSRCSRNAMLAAKLAGRPFVWHFRSIKWHWAWHEGFLLRWADELVAVSRACAESLRRFYPKKEIHVIYNGVELAPLAGDRIEARNYVGQSLGLSAEVRYVLGVGNVVPRKGYERAVEMMGRLGERAAHLHLVIAGKLDSDASYVDEIRSAIAAQGLAGRVHLLGLRTDIPRLLAGADLFLHTANRDSHPRAVIEAMAAGLPVVAFAVDGVAETVVDGETGYLVPLDDVAGLARAVLSLQQDPSKAFQMGQAGMERVKRHFTASGTAAQVSQVLERLLEKNA